MASLKVFPIVEQGRTRWRWILRAGNHHVLARSPHGFSSMRHAYRHASQVLHGLLRVFRLPDTR